MELTINGQVYQFNFGMGFLREMNKKVNAPVDGIKDVQKGIGLRYTVSSVMDGDVEALEELLLTANKGQEPRVTQELLDEHIDDPDTDIDQLFEDVLGFLKTANATKKCLQEIETLVAEEKARQKAMEEARLEAAKNQK